MKDIYLIHRHAGTQGTEWQFWAEGDKGYTALVSEAKMFTFAQAKEIEGDGSKYKMQALGPVLAMEAHHLAAERVRLMTSYSTTGDVTVTADSVTLRNTIEKAMKLAFISGVKASLVQIGRLTEFYEKNSGNKEFQGGLKDHWKAMMDGHDECVVEIKKLLPGGGQ